MDKEFTQLAFFVAVISFIILLLILVLVNLMLTGRNRRLKHHADMIGMEARAREEIEGIRREVTESLLSDVSRDLHDEVGQLLTFGILQLENMTASPKEMQPQMMTEVKQSVRDALDSVRSISRGLSPDFVNQTGLIASIEQLFERASSRTGIKTKLNVGKDFIISAPSHAIIVFRIVRECLTNAIRHGQATGATLILDAANDHVVAEFTDNGAGFQQEADDKDGLGMTTMKHYASLVNGTLTCTSAPGKGTTITLKFPNSIAI